MKKLILLRHAKSSWADPCIDDHDRSLNRRGKASAPVIARWLSVRRHLADRILCSSAIRARNTVERMRDAAPDLPRPEIKPELYHASPDAMRACLARQPGSVEAVMIVGHQPGMSALAQQLASPETPPGFARAFRHFPTAAAAVLEFGIEDWGDIENHSGRFVDFATPRELQDR